MAKRFWWQDLISEEDQEANERSNQEAEDAFDTARPRPWESEDNRCLPKPRSWKDVLEERKQRKNEEES